MIAGTHDRKGAGVSKVEHWLRTLARERRLLADPLARLPLSLPDVRWPTGPGAERLASFAPCKGAVPVPRGG